jgi:murein DD-endopeptidase MepM/ murein hydrolase activator NlpD/LAS superfamily LD-carboxypeptidase LdcB
MIHIFNKRKRLFYLQNKNSSLLNPKNTNKTNKPTIQVGTNGVIGLGDLVNKTNSQGYAVGQSQRIQGANNVVSLQRGSNSSQKADKQVIGIGGQVITAKDISQNTSHSDYFEKTHNAKSNSSILDKAPTSSKENTPNLVAQPKTPPVQTKTEVVTLESFTNAPKIDEFSTQKDEIIKVGQSSNITAQEIDEEDEDIKLVATKNDQKKEILDIKSFEQRGTNIAIEDYPRANYNYVFDKNTDLKIRINLSQDQVSELVNLRTRRLKNTYTLSLFYIINGVRKYLPKVTLNRSGNDFYLFLVITSGLSTTRNSRRIIYVENQADKDRSKVAEVYSFRVRAGKKVNSSGRVLSDIFADDKEVGNLDSEGIVYEDYEQIKSPAVDFGKTEKKASKDALEQIPVEAVVGVEDSNQTGGDIQQTSTDSSYSDLANNSNVSELKGFFERNNRVTVNSQPITQETINKVISETGKAGAVGVGAITTAVGTGVVASGIGQGGAISAIGVGGGSGILGVTGQAIVSNTGSASDQVIQRMRDRQTQSRKGFGYISDEQKAQQLQQLHNSFVVSDSIGAQLNSVIAEALVNGKHEDFHFNGDGSIVHKQTGQVVQNGGQNANLNSAQAIGQSSRTVIGVGQNASNVFGINQNFNPANFGSTASNSPSNFQTIPNSFPQGQNFATQISSSQLNNFSNLSSAIGAGALAGGLASAIPFATNFLGNYPDFVPNVTNANKFYSQNQESLEAFNKNIADRVSGYSDSDYSAPTIQPNTSSAAFGSNPNQKVRVNTVDSGGGNNGGGKKPPKKTGGSSDGENWSDDPNFYNEDGSINQDFVPPSGLPETEGEKFDKALEDGEFDNGTFDKGLGSRFFPRLLKNTPGRGTDPKNPLLVDKDGKSVFQDQLEPLHNAREKIRNMRIGNMQVGRAMRSTVPGIAPNQSQKEKFQSAANAVKSAQALVQKAQAIVNAISSAISLLSNPAFWLLIATLFLTVFTATIIIGSYCIKEEPFPALRNTVVEPAMWGVSLALSNNPLETAGKIGSLGINTLGGVLNGSALTGEQVLPPSEFRKMIENAVSCKDKVECTTGGATSGGNNQDNTDISCIKDTLANKPDTEKLTLWKAQGGVSKSTDMTVGTAKEILSFVGQSGITAQTAAWVISLATTESAGGNWNLQGGADNACYGIIQFCTTAAGGNTYQAFSLAALGRTPPIEEFRKDKLAQMRVANYAFKEKVKIGRFYPKLADKTDIELASAFWLGSCGVKNKTVAELKTFDWAYLQGRECGGGVPGNDYAEAAKKNYKIITCESTSGSSTSTSSKSTNLDSFNSHFKDQRADWQKNRDEYFTKVFGHPINIVDAGSIIPKSSGIKEIDEAMIEFNKMMKGTVVASAQEKTTTSSSNSPSSPSSSSSSESTNSTAPNLSSGASSDNCCKCNGNSSASGTSGDNVTKPNNGNLPAHNGKKDGIRPNVYADLSPEHRQVLDEVAAEYGYKPKVQYAGEFVNVGGQKMQKEAGEKANEMIKAAAKEGITLNPGSGFRSLDEQVDVFFSTKSGITGPISDTEIFNGKNKDAAKKAYGDRLRASAVPGWSEHMEGKAIDFSPIESSFGQTKAYQWLKGTGGNAGKASNFGFRETYKPNGERSPEEKNAKTMPEPWHWYYIGTDKKSANWGSNSNDSNTSIFDSFVSTLAKGLDFEGVFNPKNKLSIVTSAQQTSSSQTSSSNSSSNSSLISGGEGSQVSITSSSGNCNGGSTSSGGVNTNPLGGVDNKYLTTARTDLAGKNSKKFVILHYTAMGVSNTTYTADQMSQSFKTKAETRGSGGGYVHFTTGSQGEIYQILPDDFISAGSLGLIKKSDQTYTTNSNSIQIEMHYDAGVKVKEKATDAMLKSTAKIVAKYASDPTQVFAHWGTQPWNRSDVDWIKTNGDIDPQLIQFIGYVQEEGVWKGKDPTAIAKIITKNNIQNALDAYNSPIKPQDKITDGETSRSTLNSGLEKLKDVTVAYLQDFSTTEDKLSVSNSLPWFDLVFGKVSVSAQTDFKSRTGGVSFYGGPTDSSFNGKPTASGKIFNPEEMTAAAPYKSKSDKAPIYPFGTKVKVTNPDNKKAIVVTITDTGNFGTDAEYGGRILDMSAGSFAKIADPSVGVIKNALVEITDEAVTNNPTAGTTSTGSFSDSSQNCDSGALGAVNLNKDGWTNPLPKGVYTSPRGMRSLGLYGGTPRMHEGIDIATPPPGSTIVAAKDGKVTIVCEGGVPPCGGFGTLIVIDHGGGVTTDYGHWVRGSSKVKVGDEVKAGTQLAQEGREGSSTAIHLHFNVKVNDQFIDPCSVLTCPPLRSQFKN